MKVSDSQNTTFLTCAAPCDEVRGVTNAVEYHRAGLPDGKYMTLLLLNLGAGPQLVTQIKYSHSSSISHLKEPNYPGGCVAHL